MNDQKLTDEPYQVERESEGCALCGANTMWRIVFTPEEIAESTFYEEKERAEELAEDLNSAFQKGRASVLPASAPADHERHEFQNFHRNLCERFGYSHDPVDWKRDQASLIEHIASLVTQTKPCAKCGKPKEASRPNSHLCRSCDHGGTKLTTEQYRLAGQEIYENSAGCNFRSGIIDRLAGILQYRSEVPEVPEAIKDLLWPERFYKDDQEFFKAIPQVNETILEAYRRGKGSK